MRESAIRPSAVSPRKSGPAGLSIRTPNPRTDFDRATNTARATSVAVGAGTYSDPVRALPLYFETLRDALGPMRWWPARSSFEVIVGAILTQNTAWSNVELAIINLRRARLLTPRAVERVPLARLAGLIRSSGYYREKAKKLKAFVQFLREGYGGSVRKMFRTPTAALRVALLEVRGIGPETADAILLYAGGHATFVVDAYTHRLLARHELTPGRDSKKASASKREYESVRAMFENSLPHDAALYNEFHALIVHVGKNWCRKAAPRCEECPLKMYLPVNSPYAGHALEMSLGHE
jgi:endonuclease-3 related protein